MRYDFIILPEFLSRQAFYIKALDCPGAWAIIKEEFQFIVLGRFTVKIFEKIKPEEKCIVLGWKTSEEGRKISAGTALYSADGQLYGMGKAVWIKIESP